MLGDGVGEVHARLVGDAVAAQVQRGEERVGPERVRQVDERAGADVAGGGLAEAVVRYVEELEVRAAHGPQD